MPKFDKHFDVAIVGSGFAGSLLGWILASQSVRVVILDAAKHPRFAVGESSTPIADLLLRKLGTRYGLQPLVDLSTYSSWKRTYPQLGCGKKRGFSYYFHHLDKPFHDDASHLNSLLVAASPNDETADTHWLRSDVDQFFVSQAERAGAIVLENTRIRSVDWKASPRIAAFQHGKPAEFTTDFIVNATGQANVSNLFPCEDFTERLLTKTRSEFTHFHQVRRWSDMLDELGLGESQLPFDPDDAAQHHITPEGWLWCLRMHDDLTSVGWTSPLSVPQHHLGDLNRFPSIESMLSKVN